jgi:hypothetical protein
MQPQRNTDTVRICQESADSACIVQSDADICWTAFRTGASHYSTKFVDLTSGSRQYRTILVLYGEICGPYANQSESFGEVMSEFAINQTTGFWFYGVDNCTMGNNIQCQLTDEEETSCRFNTRMLPVLILTVCLTVKAIYMLTVNWKSRSKIKEHCLTFGDAVVASVLSPEIRVNGECLVSVSDFCRREVMHRCHAHCTDKIPSKQGDDIGHCQECKKFNDINNAAGLPHPTISTKKKRSLLAQLGQMALTQMIILVLCSLGMIACSGVLVSAVVSDMGYYRSNCQLGLYDLGCNMTTREQLDYFSGGWGGLNASTGVAGLRADSIGSELIAISVSNGAQFIFSLLYLLLIYNLTLCSQEHDWGKFELQRIKIRTTLVKGPAFEDHYWLQLPPKVLFPIMAFSTLIHWLLGESFTATETVWYAKANGTRPAISHSQYHIAYASYPVWVSTVLICVMTALCWKAYSYKREGFMPQMFGSVRVCCASTTELDEFSAEGIQWGDCKRSLFNQKWHRMLTLAKWDLESISVMLDFPRALWARLNPVRYTLVEKRDCMRSQTCHSDSKVTERIPKLDEAGSRHIEPAIPLSSPMKAYHSTVASNLINYNIMHATRRLLVKQ